MASLTGQLVAETYKALLKVIDNDIITASEKQITDGLGGGSNVFIDSQGFLRANKYKVTNGLATQFLKADGSLDTNTYLTSITGAQVITALGFTPVPTTRTITINGETHNLAADNTWTIGGTAAIWGNITGTLSNQTDLQNALNAKFDDPTGTISQYIRGDGSIANFPTIAGGLPTGGTAGQILSKIDSTDYNAHWIDNYATQTKNEVKLGATLAKGAAVYVSSANGTNMIVSAASNTSEATSSKTFGLLETGGVTNDQVKCVTFGLIAGLDTSAASAGDPVWLGVNGALIFGLANKPVAPAHMVYIGVVTRVQSNNGEIFVNVQNGFEIEELHDVLIQSKVNNQGLFYESSTGLWKNKSIATVLGYTPQAQLDGTGFVKASGTTISYDNSTYLTTADAASTYLALTGGTLSGNLTISSANPKLLLTDTDNNPDYSIQNYNGTFKISDETNSADRFFIYSTGIGYYNGDFKANKLFVEGGLSTQFIKGDGTLDTNTYLTATSLDSYLAKAGGTMTGDLNFYTLKTTRVGGNAYIRGNWEGTYWGLGAAATGHTIIIDQVDFSTGAYESITDVNLMLGTRTVVHSGNVATYALPITGGTVTGSITATSFVKSGGTSTQFLMADGSVTTLSSPVTGSGSAGYIPKWTTAANIGSSLIYDDGTSIGIAYTTPNKGGYGRTLTGASFGSASFGFEAVSNTTTNGGLIGGLSFIVNQNDSSRIVGSAIQSNLVGTTATNYGADLRFFAKADGGVIGEIARMTSAGLRVYGTIVKDGGTSSQYLMADGSVTTLTGVVTGSGTSGYLPKWTSASAVGNSLIFDNGTSIGINTVSPSATLSILSGGDQSAFTVRSNYAGNYNIFEVAQESSDGILKMRSANGTQRIQISSVTGGSSHSYINNGGRLGVGTNAPGMKVDAFGGASLSGTSFGVIRGCQDQTDYRGAALGYDTSGQIGVLYSESNGSPSSLAFWTYSGSAWGERVRMTGSGNLLVNTQTDSGYRLDVNGTSRFQSNILLSTGGNGYFFFDRPNNGFDAVTIYRTNAANKWILGTRGNSNDNFHLYSYGTSNQPLEINYSTGAATFSNSVTSGTEFISLNGYGIKSYIGSSATGANIQFTSSYYSGWDGIYQSSGSTNDFGIWTNGGSISQQKFVIKNGGYVGIGTASPSGLFHIDHGDTYHQGILHTFISTFVTSTKFGRPSTASNIELRYDIAGSEIAYINRNYSSAELRFNRDVTTDMAISGNGKVSIGGGANSFDAQLVVSSNSTPFSIRGATGYSRPFMWMSWDVSPDTGTIFANALKFYTNSNGSTYAPGSVALTLASNQAATFASSVTATSFFESSDIRLKTLIESNPIINGIEKLEAKLYEKNGKIELGYFAQDAELIMPYAVSKNDEGFLNLSYREIHTAKIARLEKEVAELKEKLNVA